MNTISVIDPVATGRNLNDIRRDRDISVTALRDILGFSTTNAIYKWFRGDSLPTLDNMVILSSVLNVSLNDMIITR
ncbi:MAG: helix-turn-helix domain-containing protein [Lachnospiraceae bacterium]